MSEQNGATLVAQLEVTSKHRVEGLCPHCNESIRTTALVSLAYTFETCRCASVPYPHLVETIWHRRCLALVESCAASVDMEALGQLSMLADQ